MKDCYIVGRGPSLLTVKREEFGPGPVIALNRGIEQVRALNLRNPIYAMAKDGCVESNEHGRAELPGHGCTLTAVPPETLLLSSRESVNCLPDYPARIILDVEALGLPWWYQSAPVAVAWAISQGATRIFMFGHDAFLNGDTRRVQGDVLIDEHDSGYVEASKRAQEIANAADVPLLWRGA